MAALLVTVGCSPTADEAGEGVARGMLEAAQKALTPLWLALAPVHVQGVYMLLLWMGTSACGSARGHDK
jgi:hypothetical protein